MKTCAKCSETKLESEFHKNFRSKDGCCSYCKICAKEIVAEWKKKNPDKRRQNQARHHKKYQERYQGLKKEREAKNPEKYRAFYKKHARKHWLKSEYNLTEAEVQVMLQGQNNKCGICGCSFNGLKKPVIDHCHATGKVRELLCNGCNMALGHIENTEFFERALKYLQRHNSHG